MDTLVVARSTCTANCAPRNREHSSRNRERSTSKARRARQVSEIEPAPPWLLISKETTQPHKVVGPQPSQASGEGAPTITPAPVRARRENRPWPHLLTQMIFQRSFSWAHLDLTRSGSGPPGASNRIRRASRFASSRIMTRSFIGGQRSGSRHLLLRRWVKTFLQLSSCMKTKYS